MVTHAHSAPRNPVVAAETLGILVERLRHLIDDSHRRVNSIAVGATGVWGDASRFDTAPLRPLDAQRIIVADDGLTAHLGALGGESGIVSALGTGIVTVRTTAEGDLHHLGGLGLLLDDRGSGAWIGQRAAQMTIDASAGTENEVGRLSVEILGPVQSWSARVAAEGPRLLAGLCRPLAALARTGDAAAMSLFTDAAVHIARSIRSAAEIADGDDGSIRTALTGGAASAADLFLPTLIAHTRDLPLDFTSPLGTPLDGAERLLALPAESLSSPMLHVSSVHAPHTVGDAA